MDLALSREQEQLVDAVRRTFDRASADAPSSPRAFDASALAALDAGGLLDVVTGGGSLVDAVLVVEAAGLAGVCAPVAARVVVAPALLQRPVTQRVVALVEGEGSLVRFAPSAELFLVLVGDRARAIDAGDVRLADVDLPRGYPFARMTSVPGGTDLGPGSGARLTRLWRTALAAEAGGLMTGAVLTAAAHVRDRRQFGRPIGSYQAVQHRLALAHVAAEGSRWLARWAAWHPDNDEHAAAAAAHAQAGAREVVRHVHQVCGAIGITDEF
ncbi:MAG: hypothetical protein QOE84_1654, partial [Actinomycetota bacterium]|nr:hypothetical protein [Actinomycetota bacterium]